MLGCSYCGSVGPAGWFPLGPVLVLLAVVAVVGIALLVTTRPGRRERLGAVLIGGTVLALAASIVVGESARTDVFVESTTTPPVDTGAWKVTCESPFPDPVARSASPLSAASHDACAAATAADRTRIYLLLGLSAALLVAGAAVLWPTRRPPRRPDEPAPGWSSPAPSRLPA